MVFDEIGKNLGEFLDTEKGRETLRMVLEEMLGTGEHAGLQTELKKLKRKKSGIEKKINSILDNLTTTNREFADRRIRELKGELDEVVPRIQELELSSTDKLDMEGLLDELLGYLSDLQTVAGEGTVEERRRFVRAFTKTIELDPESGKGRAQLPMLPDLAAAPRFLGSWSGVMAC